jgi:long-chain acyl-CoA synthetase
MNLNLAVLLREPARSQPDRSALVYGDKQVSYGVLDEQARCLAGGLRKLGINAGQHVAVLTPNVPAFSAAYFGCHYAACPVVPINALLAPEEIAFLLRDSDAVALIAWERLLPQATEALAKAGVPARLIVAKSDSHDTAVPAGAHSLAELLDCGAAVRELPLTAPTDTAVVLYTSGTTGRPKGAELTHFNLFYNADCVALQVLSLTSDTVALACLPLTHSFGQTIMHNAVLRVGGRVVLLPRFEPRTALSLIEKHRVSFFGGVPTMYQALLRELDAAPADLSSLRRCATAGASTPMPILSAFKARFGISILEGYGLSETSPGASFCMPFLPHKPGTIGVPLYGVEFRLERPDGSVITSPGERGEICIKGPNVMKGYYKRPEDTRRAIRDGWFHSGDVGVVDADGYYSIVDRIKDMIIAGGFNVYPREVEEVLNGHPEVASSCVIGVADPTIGEEVRAFVVPRPEATVTASELTTYARERLAVYKVPRQIILRSTLPLGPTGKVLKEALRAELAKEQGRT